MTPEPIYDKGVFIRYQDEGDCPDVDNHTESPNNYVEFDRWANKMHKTHIQKQCPSCGFWALWEKRK